MSGKIPDGTSPAGEGQLLTVTTGGSAEVRFAGHQWHQLVETGCRAAYLGPDPRDHRRAVISILAGVEGKPPGESDAVLFTLSAAGLDALADDLRRAAEHIRRTSAPIDLRHVL